MIFYAFYVKNNRWSDLGKDILVLFAGSMIMGEGHYISTASCKITCESADFHQPWLPKNNEGPFLLRDEKACFRIEK